MQTPSAASRYLSKDNEFIAWYPNNVTPGQASDVWDLLPCAYYVHIPFCTAICDYCGFSIAKLKESNPREYCDALLREIELYRSLGVLKNRKFVCGHYGGGTPSAIPAKELIAIKTSVEKLCELGADAEITVEVNPISFSDDHGKIYKDGGINRISFGVQSFSDKNLRTIGRPHRTADTLNTLRVIRENQFDNFSIDLMYGIPGQTIEELQEDIRMSIDTGAPHVTCFKLEVIPFTALKLREGAGELPPKLDDVAIYDMEVQLAESFASAGYRQYGAFNFAKPGFESKHNKIAFDFPQGEYIGFGNSSYSFINNYVYCNQASIGEYQSLVNQGQLPIALATPVSTREKMSRAFVLGLKFSGVSTDLFESEFGVRPEVVFSDKIEELVASGLLELQDRVYRVTNTGLFYINNVCKEFYTEHNKNVRQHLQFTPNITNKQIEMYAKAAFKKGLFSREELGLEGGDE